MKALLIDGVDLGWPGESVTDQHPLRNNICLIPLFERIGFVITADKHPFASHGRCRASSKVLLAIYYL